MNIDVSEIEKKRFSLEDIVSYSNIEITNVNDNKPPAKVIATKVIIGIVIALLALAVILV
jgi:hypothetical protein